VNYLALYVNGEMVPSRPYTPNFTSGHYIRDYTSLFRGTGVLYSDKTIDISRSEYANGYTLWVFDLTPDQANSRCISPQRTGTVRLELKFAAALASTINVVCYAEFESLIEIVKYRNVIAPYN